MTIDTKKRRKTTIFANKFCEMTHEVDGTI